jgi:hypothetical protein
MVIELMPKTYPGNPALGRMYGLVAHIAQKVCATAKHPNFIVLGVGAKRKQKGSDYKPITHGEVPFLKERKYTVYD